MEFPLRLATITVICCRTQPTVLGNCEKLSLTARVRADGLVLLMGALRTVKLEDLTGCAVLRVQLVESAE